MESGWVYADHEQLRPPGSGIPRGAHSVRLTEGESPPSRRVVVHAAGEYRERRIARRAALLRGEDAITASATLEADLPEHR
jgi:hypothetical protein